MASGHANRANRPNTWLHRPATRRKVLTCQLGAVHTWHKADMRNALTNVRFEGNNGHDADGPLCRLMTQRWGNRPAYLWIAEDLGCCASD